MIHMLAAYGDPPDPGGDVLKVLIALLPAISTIVGLCIMYAIIKSAVLAALRQHKREVEREAARLAPLADLPLASRAKPTTSPPGTPRAS